MNTERPHTGRRSLIPRSLARRLHRDERGSLSVMGVFAIFFLTVLLGMIFNVGREVDDKLKMQNAADAAAYSGTLTMARGMNAIAYTNHLLCEVFALTAYMREARLDFNSPDLANSDTVNPDALDTWEIVAREAFIDVGGYVGFRKFYDLGIGILRKLPYERQLTTSFKAMERKHADLTLPMLEYLLRGEEGHYPVGKYETPTDAPAGGPLTRFQRSIARCTPAMAQLVASEVARRNGGTSRPMVTVMYRADGSRLDEYREDDRRQRTLPAVDATVILDPRRRAQVGDISVTPGFGPENDLLSLDPKLVATDDRYYLIAHNMRFRLAHHYLRQWIYHWIDEYFTERPYGSDYGRNRGSLSQVANLFRIFACGQLDKLLNQEFPRSNLPFVMRGENPENWKVLFDSPDSLAHAHYLVPDEQILRNDYQFVAVVAWPHIRQFGPGIYRNPLNRDARSQADDTYAFTFAQAKMYLPRSRATCCPWVERRRTYQFARNTDVISSSMRDYIRGDGWPSGPQDWSLFNQNWRAKLMPTWNQNLPAIAARHPDLYGNGNLSRLSTPNLRSLTLQEIHLLNSH